jgi:hypothetical protein
MARIPDAQLEQLKESVSVQRLVEGFRVVFAQAQGERMRKAGTWPTHTRSKPIYS